jgi:hypothetical protein
VLELTPLQLRHVTRHSIVAEPQSTKIRVVVPTRRFSISRQRVRANRHCYNSPAGRRACRARARPGAQRGLPHVASTYAYIQGKTPTCLPTVRQGRPLANYLHRMPAAAAEQKHNHLSGAFLKLSTSANCQEPARDLVAPSHQHRRARRQHQHRLSDELSG